MSSAATSLLPRLGSRTARAYRQVLAKMEGFIHIRPDYYLKKGLSPKDVVCDCGLGNDANFSVDVISRFGCKVYGFDPTQKHQPSLRGVAEQYPDRFVLHPFAVSAETGELEFFESEDDISGSLDRSHKNLKGRSRTYPVTALSIREIFNLCRETYFEVLKIDIEGAEYGVLSSLDIALAANIGQLLVEFHHDVIPTYSMRDTAEAIAHLATFGFKAMTVDDRNYLFARPDRVITARQEQKSFDSPRWQRATQ
jgi:FkbM family methyltransferase